tara:strand:- start:495 stop:1169 length:675 start_codon:yes stop_codon:yes gene_type:complete
MKSLRHFLVRVPNVTRDTFTLGDKELYLDTKWDEFSHRTMEGEVVATPAKYKTEVKVGDTLYFHHHVVLGGNHLMMNDEINQLEETKKRGQFIDPDDDIYVATYDGGVDPFSVQAFAFKCKDTGKIRLIADWVFIQPEEEVEGKQEETEIMVGNQIIYLTPSKKEPEEKKGYIKWSSPKLDELGLKPGDKVLIRKSADYEMKIEGEKLWRTIITSIHGKIEEVQ